MSNKILTTDYVELFRKDLKELDKLVATPNLIREMALGSLRKAGSAKGLGYQERQQINNSIKTLENVQNDSLRENYKIINNQLCILATSSLEAILKSYFRNAANNYTNLDLNNNKLDSIRFTLREIIDNRLRFGGKLGDIIIEKERISFQDLKSIRRIFESYFGKNIELPPKLELRIIFYLEVRHVLVHKGGVVDDKFMSAVTQRKANLHNYRKDSKIHLDSDDWGVISASYEKLVLAVTEPFPATEQGS